VADLDGYTPGGDDWATDPATHAVGDGEWFPMPPLSRVAAASAAAAAAELVILRRDLQSGPRGSWWRKALAVFR
jgi:hypothetical protein